MQLLGTVCEGVGLHESEMLIIQMAELIREDTEEADVYLSQLVDKALEEGFFVESNGCGNGWLLLDMDGVSLMPAAAKGFLFVEKALAWWFWVELNRPYGARLYCISDPVEEERAAKADSQGCPNLTLINGGRDETAG